MSLCCSNKSHHISELIRKLTFEMNNILQNLLCFKMSQASDLTDNEVDYSGEYVDGYASINRCTIKIHNLTDQQVKRFK